MSVIRAHMGICTHKRPCIEMVDSWLRTYIKKDIVDFGWTWNADSLIQRSRNIVATVFLGLDRANSGDVLIYVDDDIVFAPETIERLALQCDKLKSIVAGFYVSRGEPVFIPNRFSWTKEGDICFSPEEEPIVADCMSSGFMAVHRDVFETLKPEVMYFDCEDDKKCSFWEFFRTGWEIDSNGKALFLSEDWGFCKFAQQHGITVYADPGATVGHIGEKIFTVADLKGVKLVDEAGNIRESE